MDHRLAKLFTLLADVWEVSGQQALNMSWVIQDSSPGRGGGGGGGGGDE